MKKLTIILLAATLLVACKNTTKETTEEPVAEPTTEAAATWDYKLSLAQWSLSKPIFAGERDPMDFAFTAKELGFEGLEYVSQLYVNENINFPMKEAGLEKILEVLKQRSDSLGLENLIIMVDGEGDLSLDDESETQKAVENHYKWVDAAAYLGCHSIRVNLFGAQDPEAWASNSVRSLKALGTYAAEKGVNVLVENHGGLSSDAALLARVMEETGMENVGTLPDFGNFCLKREGGARWGAPCVEEYDRYGGVEELMPYAKGVSGKSYAFDENGNETSMDYYKLIQIVKDSGYEGYIDVEFEGPEADPIPGILATKKLIEEAATAAN